MISAEEMKDGENQPGYQGKMRMVWARPEYGQ
jgi:hypothetical protein